MTTKMLRSFKIQWLKQTNLFLFIFVIRMDIIRDEKILIHLQSVVSNLWIVPTQTKWLETTLFIADVISRVLNSDYKLTDDKVFKYILPNSFNHT